MNRNVFLTLYIAQFFEASCKKEEDLLRWKIAGKRTRQDTQVIGVETPPGELTFLFS